MHAPRIGGVPRWLRPPRPLPLPSAPVPRHRHRVDSLRTPRLPPKKQSCRRRRVLRGRGLRHLYTPRRRRRPSVCGCTHWPRLVRRRVRPDARLTQRPKRRPAGAHHRSLWTPPSPNSNPHIFLAHTHFPPCVSLCESLHLLRAWASVGTLRLSVSADSGHTSAGSAPPSCRPSRRLSSRASRRPCRRPCRQRWRCQRAAAIKAARTAGHCTAAGRLCSRRLSFSRPSSTPTPPFVSAFCECLL